MLGREDMINEGWVTRNSTEKLCPVIRAPHIGWFQCHGERQGLLVFSGRTDDSEEVMALSLFREGELFALAWRVVVLGFQATARRATNGFLGGWRRRVSIRQTRIVLRQLSKCPRNTPNSYSRAPWVRTFINIETAVMVSYLDDRYRSFQWPVSILRQAKGDRREMNPSPGTSRCLDQSQQGAPAPPAPHHPISATALICA